MELREPFGARRQLVLLFELLGVPTGLASRPISDRLRRGLSNKDIPPSPSPPIDASFVSQQVRLIYISDHVPAENRVSTRKFPAS